MSFTARSHDWLAGFFLSGENPMANECVVIEMINLRGDGQVRPMPPLARQTISSGSTITLNKSTQMVSIYTTLAGTVDFTSTSGTAPTGSLAPFAIATGQIYDFGVRGGTQIRFD